MTEKLFYNNPYTISFTSTIQKLSRDANGQYFVVLDRTAFYPTGGGQPFDTGTLNGIKVFNVEEFDNELRHFIEEPIEIGTVCAGEINWDRRFDHMQQHTGQHILSAAFDNIYGYKTISFHLGEEICTIDLDIKDLTDEEAERAETVANSIILENRPIEVLWGKESDFAHYPLRKELSTTENIRLVVIPDYDYNGCGGTHPKSTAEVSSIKVLNWEKQKKHIRLYFVCGKRVIKQLHEKQKVLKKLTVLLNAPQEKMEEKVIQTQEQMKEFEKKAADLKNILLDHEANQLIENAELIDGTKIVKAIFQDRPIVDLQQLAKMISSETNDTIVFFINESHNKFQIILSRSNESNANMGQLMKEVMPLINGKGGGNASFAQGGGDKTLPAKQLLEKLRQSIVN